MNTLIAAGCNIVLNYIFIPRYGYVAAAYTTLVSYLGAFVLHANYAKKLEKELYPLNAFIRPLLHILFSVIAFYVFVNVWFIRWIIVAVYIIGMLFKERHRILYYFPNIGRLFNKNMEDR